MSLYSVMLVDDEEDVRDAIVKRLDWEAIGFKVVGTAKNGEEALEAAEQLCPDVVMTDIKMPFMDGLTFCRRLKENRMNTKIVIFSGFDEFEYAKEAIRLEVEEYILKPINAAELRRVFVSMKKALDREIAEKQNMDHLYQYYQESLPLIKEQFLAGLIQGKILPEQIEELNAAYEVSLQAPYYCVAEIRMDPGTGHLEHDVETLKQMLAVSGRKILEEQMSSLFPYRSFLYLDSIVVIAMLERPEKINRIIHYLNQFCKICKRVLGVDTTAGIGQLCSGLGQLPLSYRQAVDAAASRVLLEPNQAIYIKDIEPNSKEHFMLGNQNVLNFIRAVKLGTEEEFQAGLKEVIRHIKDSVSSLNQYQVILMEIVTETLKVIQTYDVSMNQVFGEEFDLWRELGQLKNLEILKQWLLDTMQRLRSLIRRERRDKAKVLVEQAKQYIEVHFQNHELSVDMLCSHLGVSPAYFSTVFKKETGMSFVIFLTKCRMEAAIHLLETTDQKTYMIAETVGYADPNYFSYVFKKKYGTAPSRYRQHKMGEQ